MDISRRECPNWTGLNVADCRRNGGVGKREKVRERVRTAGHLMCMLHWRLGVLSASFI